jgi:hypothetical protein
VIITLQIALLYYAYNEEKNNWKRSETVKFGGFSNFPSGKENMHA